MGLTLSIIHELEMSLGIIKQEATYTLDSQASILERARDSQLTCKTPNKLLSLPYRKARSRRITYSGQSLVVRRADSHRRQMD